MNDCLTDPFEIGILSNSSFDLRPDHGIASAKQISELDFGFSLEESMTFDLCVARSSWD